LLIDVARALLQRPRLRQLQTARRVFEAEVDVLRRHPTKQAASIQVRGKVIAHPRLGLAETTMHRSSLSALA